MNRLVIAILATFVCLPVAPGRAQSGPQDRQPDMAINAEVRRKVIDGVLEALDGAYVFPETAKKMAADIRARADRKEYDTATSAKVFVQRLTADLQAISHDKHLRVLYSHRPMAKRMERLSTPADHAKMREFAAAQNFGYEKVERLAGNVGLLEVRGFMPAELAGETAASAMNFLANCDALIIDLRKNGGGSPAGVALLCSYLFPAEPVVHLNDLYFRPDNSTHQWWTLPYVPGKRFVDKPVYVLTSKRTFSAAEECTYNLQSRKRATIVGETSGGGAHPGGVQPIDDHFGVWVPSGRAINPVTKTNWEGKGVKPEIETKAELALLTAHVDALRKLVEKHKPDTDIGRDLKEAIERVQKQLDDHRGKTTPIAQIEQRSMQAVGHKSSPEQQN